MGIQSNIRDALLPQPPSFKKKKEYTILETLGRGGFGKVVKAHWKAEGEGKDVALKIIPKKLVKHDLSLVTDEINVLKSLDHPNIVHVWDHFESRDKYYITFELAIGGELFDRITQRGRFTEKDAVECIRQVLEATVYLHSKEIVHRDLKPENVLYKTQSHHSPIVIADFGIAKHLEYDVPDTTISPSSTISDNSSPRNPISIEGGGGDDEKEGEGKGKEEEPREGGVDSFAGSFGYAAPEVLLGLRHGLKVDCWSIGVIAYTLLCGYSPFRSDDKAALVEETKRGKVVFHERYWRKVSDTAKDFIRGMLVVDPKMRMSAREALDHPWMTNGKATTHDLSTTTNLQSNPFNAKAKFHAAVHAVNASNRIQRLARSRSGSLDTLTSSIMSTSSPTNASPEKLGQGSRKSSLNAFTAPGGDRESDDSGYVTAEDEDDLGQSNTAAERETPASVSRGIEDPTIRTTPPEDAPVENASASGGGVRGLLGRMRL